MKSGKGSFIEDRNTVKNKPNVVLGLNVISMVRTGQTGFNSSISWPGGWTKEKDSIQIAFPPQQQHNKTDIKLFRGHLELWPGLLLVMPCQAMLSFYFHFEAKRTRQSAVHWDASFASAANVSGFESLACSFFQPSLVVSSDVHHSDSDSERCCQRGGTHQISQLWPRTELKP